MPPKIVFTMCRLPDVVLFLLRVFNGVLLTGGVRVKTNVRMGTLSVSVRGARWVRIVTAATAPSRIRD